MAVTIPPRLAAACANNAHATAWFARLPVTLEQLQRRWLLVTGAPFASNCSWVAPVTLASGATAVLKVSMPHLEGEHEIQGLRFWSGNPTVRLLAADEDFGATLLERCEPGTPLRALPESDQDVVIARLLRRMWRVPSGPQRFRPLSEMTAHWSDETLTQADHWPDTDLVREGLRLLKELSQSASSHPLLATDLHAGNVLRADREPWLVIDPKPFVGDPAYDATQHLLNCGNRLRSDPENTIRRFADLLDIDSERVRLWTFARAAAEPRNDWQDSSLMDLARALAG